MYDVAVVGGGTSGVPLAFRLAERGASVLLVEAGPADHDSLARVSGDPRRVTGALASHDTTLGYDVDITDDRRWRLHRGRILGGSSAVNGGYFIRARAEDYDRWALSGGERWSFARVLPVLRRLERDVGGTAGVHGVDGPMPVERTRLDHPLCVALLESAHERGIVDEPDKNDQSEPGIGPVPVNHQSGRRISTAEAYLAGPWPAGLTIRGDRTVTRVRIEGGRATGVELGPEFVEAGAVVLAAGAIGSAHLLLLSGVGPEAELAQWAIPTLAALPVGEGVSDHPHVTVERTIARDLPPPRAWLGAAMHSSSPGSTHPGNVELLQSLLPMSALTAGTVGAPVASLIVSDVTPRVHGRLRLRSASALVPPQVELRYLGADHDLGPLRHGVRLAAGLLTHDAFGSGGPIDGLDAAALDSDAAVDTWIRTRVGTAVHTCSSAPMGSVVDGSGAVHGIRGLHVADTSILPTAPLRGPANTAVLVGELIADAICAS